MKTAPTGNMPGSTPLPAPHVLEAVWRHSPWGMLVIDGDGNVSAVNPSAEYHTAKPAAELIAQSEANIHTMLSMLQGAHQRVEVEMNAGKPGSIHFVRARSSRQHDAAHLESIAQMLRDPLASVYGFTELLLTQGYDEETRMVLTTTLMEQIERMTNIINEHLDLRPGAR